MKAIKVDSFGDAEGVEKETIPADTSLRYEGSCFSANTDVEIIFPCSHAHVHMHGRRWKVAACFHQ
jgi:hypothetical protein